MQVVNKDVEPGEPLVVNSRYSIVIATAKRARQIISDRDPFVLQNSKPLSVAINEINTGKVTILGGDEFDSL
jgi:DNA-directed RNA polymerase subunit omega